MRNSLSFTTCCGLVALACVSSRADAQAPAGSVPRNIVLARANATVKEKFSSVGSVRELQDGRVLVTDKRDNLVYIVDFTGSTNAQPLGRRGKGPGEYEQVGRLWPLGGDSTLMLEPMMRRGLIFNGSQVVHTVSATSPLLTLIEKPLSIFLGRDGKGAILAQVMSIGKAGPNPADSMLLVRAEANGSKVDTLARMSSVFGMAASAGSQVSAAGGAGAGRAARYAVNLQSRDQAALFPDGAVAIVRANPYRVDWCLPTGRCQQGAVSEQSKTRISDDAKEAILLWWSQTSVTLIGRHASEMTGWPAVLPAFVVGGNFDDTAVRPEPRGNVLVERVPTKLPAGSTYDIVDRDGRRIAVVRLDVHQRIVGFGTQSVFTVDIDSDGLQSLKRHDWKY
jgi:hypothetical protein